MNNIKLFRVNPLYNLLKFKLSWHEKVVKDILIKYKILIIFILLLITPSLHALVDIIISPATAVVSQNSSLRSIFQSLILYQVIGFIWFYLQSSAFNNQPAQNYINALPLSKRDFLLIDLFMLFIADLLIWCPLFVAIYKNINWINSTELFILAEKVICIFFMVLNLQITCLRKNTSKIAHLLFLNILLIFSFKQQNYFYESILFIIYSFSSLIFIRLCYNEPTVSKIIYFNKITKNKNKQFFKIRYPLVRIISKQIIMDNPMQFAQSVVMLTAILILVFFFSKYGIKNNNFSFVVSCLTLLSSLVLSHLFAKIDIERKLYKEYLTTLPISKLKIFYNDYLFVGAIQTLFFIFLYIIIFMNTSFLKYKPISVFIISLLFLAFTYYPQVNYKKYGTIISLILMVIFMWTNYFLIKNPNL